MLRPLLVLAFLPLPGVAQEVEYVVSFPNVVHHEAEVEVRFTELPERPLEMRMSRSSPGRYALHEFAKNVYNVRAVDGRGNSLTIRRPDPYQWDVMDHDGAVTVRYTLFADRADGTYSQFDETHAHMNMPATFMWARGLGERPIRITFRPPIGSGWRAATQLHPTDHPMTFTAPTLDYFLDSPTELSDFSLREWTVPMGTETATIRLAVHHQGTEVEVDAYADMVRRVVAEEIAVFGEPPAFDGGTYTFIADYLPYASGDGMEHRNSTILSSTGSLARNAAGLLGTVSHEFFHAWNVERIRPASLEPFDFERANMSRELWFAEGFTSYYTPLFIRRAGLRSNAEYGRAIQGGINTLVTAPGSRFFSAVEMSMQAPFVDAATAVDPVSRHNTFISYYTWGAVIGLNLDLTLRTRFGRTLDDFMRHVWREFGAPEAPYTVSDLEQALGSFTGDAEFAAVFFLRYITGRDVPDYGALLAPAGFLVRPASPGRAWAGGARLRDDAGGLLVDSYTAVGSPLYQAGIDRGDRIVAVNDAPVTSVAAWRDRMARDGAGTSWTVTVRKRDGRERRVELTLAADPAVEVVTFEEAGRPVTPAIESFRASWLGSRAR